MGDKVHRNSLKSGHKLHWYRIEKVLGQGGFGITYLAYDNNLQKNVAIKEYLPIELAVREGDFSVQPVTEDRSEQFQWGLDRFLSEARTLAQFDHPNIVRVYAVFEDNNTGYMVMNYEQGVSLAEKLKGRKTLEESELIKYLIPIMGGLEQMHSTGFIHRDIKPDNIFIRNDSSPVLLDFGSARQALGGQTRTLTSLVTPGFAPFEQYYAKSNEQGPWTDIYGLGATLYRATTGTPPADAVDRSNALLKRKNDTYISCREFGNGKYSERFLSAIDHALQFNIEERPKNISEWRKDFGLPTAPLVAAKTDHIPTQPGTAYHHSESRTASPAAKMFRLPLYLLPKRVTIVILMCLVVIGVSWFYKDELMKGMEQFSSINKEIDTTVTESLASQRNEQDHKAKISNLLTEAKIDFEALRLIQPENDNALQGYRRVLELDPENTEARQGLNNISDKLVALAHNATNAGDLTQAESYINEAATIAPDAVNIQLIRNELDLKKKAQERAEAEAKARREKAQALLKEAETAAEKGDALTTLAKLDQARNLGADTPAINTVREHLRSKLEMLAATEMEKAQQAVKAKDTAAARAALSRAKDFKSKADALAIP